MAFCLFIKKIDGKPLTMVILSERGKMSRRKPRFVVVEVEIYFPAPGRKFGYVRTKEGEQCKFRLCDGVQPIASSSGRPAWRKRPRARIPTPHPHHSLFVLIKEMGGRRVVVVWMDYREYLKAYDVSERLRETERIRHTHVGLRYNRVMRMTVH